MTPDEFASLARRDFQIEYRVADPENGWNGQESDYAPWTITIVTYKDEEPLPEDEWLRYAEFDIESGLAHVATHLGLPVGDVTPQRGRDVEMVIQAAAQVLSRAALALIERDPHEWSTRPCGTCASVSAILGEPFGCIKKARQPKEAR